LEHCEILNRKRKYQDYDTGEADDCSCCPHPLWHAC
jgi:hypothetical protein